MEDFMGATAALGAEVIINFSTPPTWLYDTAGVRVGFPDEPLGETWSYEQGTQLVDPTATTIGQYYGRLLAHYTDGGFTDEGGVFHPGYLFNISHWEVLNEVEAEHRYTPQEYVTVYDAIVREMRALAPRGTRNLTWVGMALEGHDEWDWWSTFLNPANHAAGTPLDWASFHFYASCSNRTDPSGYTAFFAAADGFVEECTDIVTQQRDVLNPSMKLDADELGVILPDDNSPSAPEFPRVYWNAAAAMYAYLFGRLALVGIDVLGESQLVGYPQLGEDLPPQFPSVSMLNWTTGAGNARFWTLKLLVDTTRIGDGIVNTSVTPATANPFCGETPNLANLTLTCTSGVISSIPFADYGTVAGGCPQFSRGTCTTPNTTAVVESMCVGKASCTIPATTEVFGDPCYGTFKYLKIVAACSGGGGGYSPTSGEPVYAQGFSRQAPAPLQYVLLVNKDWQPHTVVLPGATGGLKRFINEGTGDAPAESVTVTSDSIVLEPFEVAVVLMP